MSNDSNENFKENVVISYRCTVSVNGQEAGKIEALSQESLMEQFRKLDYHIEAELRRQYEDLPEQLTKED